MSSVRTPVGVLSFPTLFVPKPPAPGTEARFSLNLILDAAAQKSPEWMALRKLVLDTLDDKWPGKSKDAEWIKKNKIKLPWRPCSDRDYEGYDVPGGIFIAPWSKNKPGLINAQRQNIDVPSDIWSGQLARCTVHAFAYEQSGNKGVGLNLNNVQITKMAMDRIDGKRKAKDEFGEVEEDGTDASSSSGGSDVDALF